MKRVCREAILSLLFVVGSSQEGAESVGEKPYFRLRSRSREYQSLFPWFGFDQTERVSLYFDIVAASFQPVVFDGKVHEHRQFFA